jgi:hypothetical protein
LESLATYGAAVQRAAQFIVDAHAPAGFSGESVDGSFKCAWGLGISGHAVQASRLLDRLKDRFLGSSGEFVPRATWRFLYPNIWLLIGAHTIGRFDVSLPVLRFLAQNQGENGGFACLHPADGRGQQDILSTAMGALACLYGNRLAEANAAAKWLQRTLDTQPEPDRYPFLNTWPTGELITDFAPPDRYLYAIDRLLPEQAYYAPGAAIVVLSKLYLATGAPEHLALARRYFEFCAGAPAAMPKGLYYYPTGGKFGWGAAWLYRATGDPAHRAAAERIGDYLVTSQREDGRWPAFHSNSDANLAAEFCVLLTEIAEALG